MGHITQQVHSWMKPKVMAENKENGRELGLSSEQEWGIVFTPMPYGNSQPFSACQPWMLHQEMSKSEIQRCSSNLGGMVQRKAYPFCGLLVSPVTIGRWGFQDLIFNLAQSWWAERHLQPESPRERYAWWGKTDGIATASGCPHHGSAVWVIKLLIELSKWSLGNSNSV